MILDAAFTVFLERGYDGASMDAIAERAGVSKPVVYASFSSKQDLFAELLRREEERILDAIAAVLPETPTLPPEGLEPLLIDGLTAFFRAIVASPGAFEVILLGAGGAEKAITSRVQRGREEQVRAITGLAQRWFADAGAKDASGDARLTGFLVIGLAEGAARALLTEPERWSPRELAERTARLVLGAGALAGEAYAGPDPAL